LGDLLQKCRDAALIAFDEAIKKQLTPIYGFKTLRKEIEK